MHFSRLFIVCSLCVCASPVLAQDESDPPYWASIRTSELNMRIGPSEDFRVTWVFKREGLPLKVVRKKEGWRLVRDPEGAQGWVVARFLSRERSAIVTGGDAVAMRGDASHSAPLRWKLAPGVIGRLGDCANDWCEFDVSGRKGWVPQDRLWGAGEP